MVRLKRSLQEDREEQHLNYTDDDVLRAVDREARRNKYLKQTLVEASRRGDEEVVESTLHQVLASLSLNVNDFFSFLQKAIHWFRNLF